MTLTQFHCSVYDKAVVILLKVFSFKLDMLPDTGQMHNWFLFSSVTENIIVFLTSYDAAS